MSEGLEAEPGNVPLGTEKLPFFLSLIGGIFMTKKDRMIARAIIHAQVASDGGKGINDIRNITRRSYVVYQAGYALKDEYVLRAIQGINRSKNSMFRYYVTVSDIPDALLVYFEFKVLGTKYQISFHCFDERLDSFLPKSSKKSHRTKWDECIGGSRDACGYLWWLIRKEVEY